MSEITKSKYIYLKAIASIGEEKKEVHAADIARELGVSKPSVKRALARLDNDGYLVEDGFVLSLSNKGKKAIRDISKKQDRIFEFLNTTIDIEEEDIWQNALDMAFVVSKTALDGMDEFVKLVDEQPDAE